MDKKIVIIIVIITVICTGLSTFCNVKNFRVIATRENDDLIAYWNFDEGAGNTTYDLSGNGNHGTIHGASDIGTISGPWVKGVSGTALRFDGIDDYVMVLDNDTLDGMATGLTISLWIRLPDYTPQIYLLVNKWTYDQGMGNGAYAIRLQNGTIRTQLSTTGDHVIWSANGSTNFSPLTDRWHHITYVWNRPFSQLYVDGIFDSLGEYTLCDYTINTTDNLFLIGAGTNQGNAPLYPLRGYIDEISLYNRALSSDEIQGLFAKHADTSPPETNHSLSGTIGCGSWYRSDVMVTLQSHDNGSGVARTMYQINEGNPQIYTGAFTINSEGHSILSYYSIDNFGNTESTKNVTVRIDKSPPKTVCFLTPPTPSGNNGWYTESIRVMLSSSDGVSGSNGTWYSLDGGQWERYMGLLTIQDEGAHIMQYYSSDHACNEEVEKAVDIKIDTEKPDIQLKKPRGNTLYIFDRELIQLPFRTVILGKVTIEAQVTDSASGIDEVLFYIDDDLRYIDTIEPREWVYDDRALLLHRHTITLSATDRAGHSQQIDDFTVWVFNF